MGLGKVWRKLDRSQGVIVSNPDTRFVNYLYQVFYNKCYHSDIDLVIYSIRDGRTLALVELIKGLSNEITHFKKESLKSKAQKLGVWFLIFNWDYDKRLIKVSCGFSGRSKVFSFKQFEEFIPRLLSFLEKKISK